MPGITNVCFAGFAGSHQISISGNNKGLCWAAAWYTTVACWQGKVEQKYTKSVDTVLYLTQ